MASMAEISKWKKYKKSWKNSHGGISHWFSVDPFFQSWWQSRKIAILNNPNQGLTVTWQYHFFKTLWKVRRHLRQNHMAYIAMMALLISMIALFK
jgi:hypothetical protein